MKTFKFSLVLRTRENTDVFITLDDNIYGIHSQRVNILYIYLLRVHFKKRSAKDLFDDDYVIFFWYLIKVCVVGTQLNCINKSMQFK